MKKIKKMKRIITRVIKIVFEPYWLSVKSIFLGFKELGKLMYHYPLHSVFVIAITGAMTTIGTSMLNDAQFSFMPFYLRVTTICVIGVSALIGSACWSVKALSYRR